MKATHDTQAEESALTSIRRGWSVEAADKAKIQSLEKSDGWRFSLWAIFHFTLYAASLAAIPFLSHPVALVAVTLLLANQLHALTILQHDCGHGSAYTSKGVNLWMGRFFSFFIFLPFSAFQEVHRRHHWFLADPERDPDEWYYAGGPRQLWFREMLFMPYFTLLPLFRYEAPVRNRVLRELIAHVVLWSAVVILLAQMGRQDILIWGIAIPMAGLGLVISPISRGYEHFPLALIPRGHQDRNDLHKNSVTITSRIFGFIWANITFHVEHHLFPRIPFFALPKAHQILSRRNAYLQVDLPLRSLNTVPVISENAHSPTVSTKLPPTLPLTSSPTSPSSLPHPTRDVPSEKEVAL
jgi:fatty acid desaturase